MSLLHQIALTCIPEVGDITARHLLSYCGTPEEIFKASKSELLKIPGIGPKIAKRITESTAFVRAEEELKFIDQHRIKTYFIADELYPSRLKDCLDAPIMLYFKGEVDFKTLKIISVVGTRNATTYGKDLCKQFIADLKSHRPLIVSGLAHGIDSVVHQECVKHEIQTIGVLGHGLDRIYPTQNQALAEKMLEYGGLLTEFPSGTRPRAEHFPRRNRIIAGLSAATIVIEAGNKGGALITANLANAYHRDVFVFPGRVDDEYSAGCHKLIQTHRAHLILKAADVEAALEWIVPAAKEQLTLPFSSFPSDLSPDERQLTSFLQERGSMAIDDLAVFSQLPMNKLAATILDLELKGVVTGMPGKCYKLA